MIKLLIRLTEGDQNIRKYIRAFLQGRNIGMPQGCTVVLTLLVRLSLDIQTFCCTRHEFLMQIDFF